MTRPILFLSDLGLKDEFFRVCHSVITRIAPDARIADLSDGVSPMNVPLGSSSSPTRSPMRVRFEANASGGLLVGRDDPVWLRGPED